MDKRKLIKFLIILFVTIILMLLSSFYSLGISDKIYRTSEKIEATDYIKDIEVGKKYEQKIIAEENNFQRIDIQFEPLTNEQNISGEVVIGIDDPDGKTISETRIIRNYIRENTVYEFKFENQENSKEKEYTFWLKFDNIEDGKNFFSVGTDEEGNLAIQEFYKGNLKQILFITVISLFCICAIGISIYIFMKRDIKPEKVFLYTIPIICLFYLACMPTFKNHDELWHWFRSYEVSIGKFMTEVNGDVLGTEMPESVSKAATDNWITITYGKVLEYLGLELEPEKTTNLYSATSAVYSAVQYIPQGIGIFLARIFTSKVLLLAYAGRLFNMILALTCLYFAIKIIPFGKKIMLLAAYIPIAIEGFASLSPDAIIISVSFLYIAYILKLAFSKEDEIIGIKQLIFLAIMSIVIALCKIVYVPLVFLLLLIPKEKFKKNKKMLNVIIIIAISFILNLLWLKMTGVYLANFRDGDSAIQIQNLFAHPITFIQNCLYTFNIFESSWIVTMYGQNLGWGEFIHVHDFVPYTLFILTLWVMFTDETIKEKFTIFQNVIMTFVILAIVGLMLISLFVNWTYCGNDYIMGVQGRYFIPLLPLIVYVIGSNLKVKTKYKEENTIKLIGIVGMVSQILVISECLITHL